MTVTKLEPRIKGRRCPICGGQALQKFRPFCSVRCTDADLGAWLGGRYRVPATEPPDTQEQEDLARALGEGDDDDDHDDNDNGKDGGGHQWN